MNVNKQLGTIEKHSRVDLFLGIIISFVFFCFTALIFGFSLQTNKRKHTTFFSVLACKTVAFCCTMYYQSGKGNLVLYLLINLTTVINETNEELTGHLPIIKRSFYCVFAIPGLECQSFNNIFVCLLKFYNKLLFYIFLLVLNVQKTKDVPNQIHFNYI